MPPTLPRRDWLALSAASALGAQTVHDEIQQLAHAASLALRFTGSSRTQCLTWQREFRSKLDTLLGDYAPPARWQATQVRKVEFTDHTREELLLRAEGQRGLPVHLLTPRGTNTRRPAVLALHGHGPFGHDAVAGLDDTPERQRNIAEANYDYGRQLVRQGYEWPSPASRPSEPDWADARITGAKIPAPSRLCACNCSASCYSARTCAMHYGHWSYWPPIHASTPDASAASACRWADA